MNQSSNTALNHDEDCVFPVSGTGLGLRREILDNILNQPPKDINFYEVAPENWIRLGGKIAHKFREITEKHDFVTHGLSLSLGGLTPIDVDFVKDIKTFLKQHQIKIYSEHLSYCSDQGHLYDLMPIPFTEEAATYVAERIQQVQDILGEQIAIENVSYYAAPGQEMPEIDFLKSVLQQADCKLLLDVNNIYVNSINHKYDAYDFLQQIPEQRISYVHVAGHYNEAEDLLIDTHGADINNPVWKLLEQTYALYGELPTLLERDFNIPPMDDLLKEVKQIKILQNQSSKNAKRKFTSN
jgi:uncharacterized protein (UPF0276 family)